MLGRWVAGYRVTPCGQLPGGLGFDPRTQRRHAALTHTTLERTSKGGGLPLAAPLHNSLNQLLIPLHQSQCTGVFSSIVSGGDCHSDSVGQMRPNGHPATTPPGCRHPVPPNLFRRIIAGMGIGGVTGTVSLLVSGSEAGLTV